MTEWCLETILGSLHDEIEQRLLMARRSFGHPGTKGNASENVWLELFNNYLPKRYHAASGHIVDSLGHFSDQIDLVIFDRQYSPFIFQFNGQLIIPAESVYAVFEAKQSINSDYVEYAQQKVATVRELHRTSLPIPHAGGIHSPKTLPHISGGLLAFESDWKPPLGQSLQDALNRNLERGRLDLGCVAAHGTFGWDETEDCFRTALLAKPATAFLFELIAALQSKATVPMIDVRAYARWLIAPDRGHAA